MSLFVQEPRVDKYSFAQELWIGTNSFAQEPRVDMHSFALEQVLWELMVLYS